MPGKYKQKRGGSFKRGRKKPAPLPTKELSGEIGSLALQGDGILIEGSQKYHIPFTAPGDQGVFAVSGQRGTIKNLTKPGNNRREPPCPHHGTCGGCQMQHIDLDYYKAWKTGLIKHFLQRENFGDVPVLPLMSSSLKTRRRAGITLQRMNNGIVAGFREKRSHTIVPITTCDVLHPAIFKSLEALKELAQHFLIDGTKALTAFVTQTQTGLDIDLSGAPDEAKLTLAQREAVSATALALDFARLTLNGAPFLTVRDPVVRFQDVSVALPIRGFLQATKEGEETLIDLVADFVGDASKIADLFSGTGTFALSLAKPSAGKRHVYAAESNAPAIKALTVAAGHAGLSVETEIRDLDRQPLMPAALQEFDAVVFDPPRAGAEPQAQQLAKSDVPKLVGVSCNPQTFVRDAVILREGGYRLLSVQPVDQFLFTPHIELVGLFQKG